MRKKDPFKSVIGEYVLIFFVLGFTLWLALGSITEFAIPLDSLKKISGTVSHVEYKASNCRLSRGEISECTRTIIRLKDNQSSYALTSFDNESPHISALKKGDSVDIYTRHWYQIPLSLNEGQRIYHLQKGNTVILELFSQKPEAVLGLIIVGVLIIFVSLIFLPALIQWVKES